MDVPEAPRQRVHQAHGAGGEFVARRHDRELVKFAIHAHERYIVIGVGAGFELTRKFEEARALLGACPPGRASRHQPLHFAPNFQQPQLALDVDFGNDDAAPRQDVDQALARQALQGLAYGRAPDSQALRQGGLRHSAARRQLQRDDHLLQIAVSAVGEGEARLACASGRFLADFFTCSHWCLRFSTKSRNFSYSFSSTP